MFDLIISGKKQTKNTRQQDDLTKTRARVYMCYAKRSRIRRPIL